MADRPAGGSSPMLHLFLVCGIAIAIGGFIYGLSGPGDVERPGTSQMTASDPTIPLAPRYSEMSARRHAQETATIASRAPEQTGERTIGDPNRDIELARATREQRRAYDGAPPTIPHPVNESTGACVECHIDGIQLGELVAPVMSHQMLGSCTQCHVRAAIDWPWADTAMLTTSTFQGARSAEERGDIVAVPWPTAPPVTPHSTWMRSNCASCHGPLGHAALRTPHPERASCQQCHVPSAVLDQRAAADVLFP